LLLATCSCLHGQIIVITGGLVDCDRKMTLELVVTGAN